MIAVSSPLIGSIQYRFQSLTKGLPQLVPVRARVTAAGNVMTARDLSPISAAVSA